MKKKTILITTTLVISIFLYFFIYKNNNINYEEANNKMPLIECDSNETVQKGIYAFKQGNGWYQYCLNNGPVLVWKNNKVAIKGQSRNSKKYGSFIFYNSDGSIKNKIYYENGIIIKKANKQVKLVR